MNKDTYNLLCKKCKFKSDKTGLRDSYCKSCQDMLLRMYKQLHNNDDQLRRKKGQF